MKNKIKKYQGKIWINGSDVKNVTFKLEDFKKMINELGLIKYFEDGGEYDKQEKMLLNSIENKMKQDFIGDNPKEMKQGTINPLEKDRIIPLDEKKKQHDSITCDCYFDEEDIKETLQNIQEELKEVSLENDWDVAINDNEEEGFRVISGEEYINKTFLKHAGKGLLK